MSLQSFKVAWRDDTSMTLGYFRRMFWWECWQCFVPLWHWGVGTCCRRGCACVPLDVVELFIVFIQPLSWCQYANLRAGGLGTLSLLQPFVSPPEQALPGVLQLPKTPILSFCSRFPRLSSCFQNRSEIAVKLFCSVVLERRSCCEKPDKWAHVSLISLLPSLVSASSSAVDPPPRRWLLTLLHCIALLTVSQSHNGRLYISGLSYWFDPDAQKTHSSPSLPY